MKAPELLFTILDRDEAVSIVRAYNADAAIHIAENMLELCRPDHEPLRARTSTAIESSRFFEDAFAWSGGIALAGIVLNGPLANVLH
jgi:hypothetical protein